MNVDRDPGAGISQGMLGIMAAGAGVAVANLYYIQPLLADIGRTFAASPWAMGVVAMLVQVGFATGVLFFVPMGDITERRRLIVLVLGAAAASLIAFATSQSYGWLAASSFFVGTFSVAPQMFVPFAAHLAQPERRGSAVGIVMSGLLIGILVSRTVSGYVGSVVGWRAMFWLASAVTLALALFVVAALPRSAGATRLSYPRLIQSLWHLVVREPVLRESAFAGAMLFGAFSAFWSMLAFKLEAPPLHYGTRVAGLFGLIGIAGVSAAPIAGRLADRLNPRVNVRAALLVTLIAFVVFGVFGDTLWGLVVGVVVLDAGVQAGHVTNQSRIHSLLPEARNRLTTVYMVAFFLGGAVGSAFGAYAWQHWRWPGVCGVGIGMPLLAAIKLSLPERP
jgi:predicted MFS family arabinose efflux permease